MPNPDEIIQHLPRQIVVVANGVNLAVFSPFWLVREGLFTEAEFPTEAVFTNELVQIPGKDFVLTVAPDRVMLQLAPGFDRPGAFVTRIVGGIVAKLTHLPYVAIGFNFSYALVCPASQFNEWNEKMFAARAALEGSRPTLFGASWVMSWDSFEVLVDCRAALRLIPAEPGTSSEAGVSPPVGVVQVRVNYERRFETPPPTTELLGTIGAWESALADSLAIARRLAPPDRK